MPPPPRLEEEETPFDFRGCDEGWWSLLSLTKAHLQRERKYKKINYECLISIGGIYFEPKFEPFNSLQTVVELSGQLGDNILLTHGLKTDLRRFRYEVNTFEGLLRP